jgi:hypothetical protein
MSSLWIPCLLLPFRHHLHLFPQSLPLEHSSLPWLMATANVELQSSPGISLVSASIYVSWFQLRVAHCLPIILLWSQPVGHKLFQACCALSPVTMSKDVNSLVHICGLSCVVLIHCMLLLQVLKGVQPEHSSGRAWACQARCAQAWAWLVCLPDLAYLCLNRQSPLFCKVKPKLYTTQVQALYLFCSHTCSALGAWLV